MWVVVKLLTCMFLGGARRRDVGDGDVFYFERRVWRPVQRCGTSKSLLLPGLNCFCWFLAWDIRQGAHRGATSKILFTIALPYNGLDGSQTLQFFISCSNIAYLSMKRLDFRLVKFGNSNADTGWKDRFEYSVSASKTLLGFRCNYTSIFCPRSGERWRDEAD